MNKEKLPSKLCGSSKPGFSFIKQVIRDLENRVLFKKNKNSVVFDSKIDHVYLMQHD